MTLHVLEECPPDLPCQSSEVCYWFDIPRGARSSGISELKKMRKLWKLEDFGMWENLKKILKIFEKLMKIWENNQEITWCSTKFQIFSNFSWHFPHIAKSPSFHIFLTCAAPGLGAPGTCQVSQALAWNTAPLVWMLSAPQIGPPVKSEIKQKSYLGPTGVPCGPQRSPGYFKGAIWEPVWIHVGASFIAKLLEFWSQAP